MKIYRLNDVLTFGKHKGSRISTLVKYHRSYLVWLHENQMCKYDKEVVNLIGVNTLNAGTTKTSTVKPQYARKKSRYKYNQ